MADSVQDRREVLYCMIDGAFDGVELGDGVSLHESVVIDNYGSIAERRSAREPDEKHDWLALLDDPDFASIGAVGGILFYDVAGFRFHLPAYLCMAVEDFEWVEADHAMDLLMYCLTNRSDDRHATLDTRQRACVRSVLSFLRDEHELESEELDHAIDFLWNDRE